MNTGSFHDLINLWEHCDALQDRLEEVREEMSEEEWRAACSGPLGELLEAAVELKAAFKDCK